MSGYTRNAVYDYVAKAIKTECPSADCTSRFVPKPSKFPSCYIHEIDNFRPREFTQLDFQDVQWESAFEIQISCTKANIAASEAYSIMDVAKAAFSNLYYREFSETSVDDGTRFVLIGRFRRRIGGGDTMPTT